MYPTFSTSSLLIYKCKGYKYYFLLSEQYWKHFIPYLDTNGLGCCFRLSVLSSDLSTSNPKTPEVRVVHRLQSGTDFVYLEFLCSSYVVVGLHNEHLILEFVLQRTRKIGHLIRFRIKVQYNFTMFLLSLKQNFDLLTSLWTQKLGFSPFINKYTALCVVFKARYLTTHYTSTE